jgi:hypothetical protein
MVTVLSILLQFAIPIAPLVFLLSVIIESRTLGLKSVIKIHYVYVLEDEYTMYWYC